MRSYRIVYTIDDPSSLHRRPVTNHLETPSKGSPYIVSRAEPKQTCKMLMGTTPATRTATRTAYRTASQTARTGSKIKMQLPSRTSKTCWNKLSPSNMITLSDLHKLRSDRAELKQNLSAPPSNKIHQTGTGGSSWTHGAGSNR